MFPSCGLAQTTLQFGHLGYASSRLCGILTETVLYCEGRAILRYLPVPTGAIVAPRSGVSGDTGVLGTLLNGSPPGLCALCASAVDSFGMHSAASGLSDQ